MSQINELETELAEIKGIKDKLHRFYQPKIEISLYLPWPLKMFLYHSCRYVRELEQQNDDLERAKRSTLARWRIVLHPLLIYVSKKIFPN